MELYSIFRDGSGETGTWQMLPPRARGSDGFFGVACVYQRASERANNIPGGTSGRARFAAATLCQWVFVVMSEYTLCSVQFVCVCGHYCSPLGKRRTQHIEYYIAMTENDAMEKLKLKLYE